MNYTISTDPASQQSVDCLLCPVNEINENGPLEGTVASLEKDSQESLSHWIKEGDFSGKLGQTLLLRRLPSIKSPRVLLIGCGPLKKFTPTQFYQIITNSIKTIASLGITSCYFSLLENKIFSEEWQIYHAILGIEQAMYTFDRFKTKKDPASKLKNISFGVTTKNKNLETSLTKGWVVASAVKRTRDLANLPSNVCTPSFVAQEALAQAHQHPTLKVTVMERTELEKLGMRAFLAVAQGSEEAPKFIVLEYQGGKNKPLVFVGKGITFDSGGISLKPGDNMDKMRYDMCGAATVLGLLSAAAELNLPLNLVGLMPCTENMPSGKAYKPGDIISTLSGQTIEIINTDAEGRVILADALTYAKKFDPEFVIDIATLTGAITIALGDKAAGLMTNDEALASALIEAGEKSWDRVWRLPLWEEYQDQIKSGSADMANIGVEGGRSITAACLLSRFTFSYRWAHLDIAGVAWSTGKNGMSTGRPLSLLMELLFNYAS